jgi:LmbE family N-acetylglucosaminyl deacetylase
LTATGLRDDANRQRVLMAVHAHPDDESSQTGGTLARYAAAGYRTVLITCTDGGQGDGAHGARAGQVGHDPRMVVARRYRELDLAAIALCVSDVVKLGYPDSGAHDEAVLTEGPASARAFSRLAVDPLVDRVEHLMRTYRPEVVLTYPPNGLSGHPDHIRTHDIVLAAHRNIVASGGFGNPDRGSRRPPAVGPKLYYIVMSHSRLQAVQRSARAALGPHAPVPPSEMAIDDAQITTVIDVAPFWGQKLRALSAHASQSDAAAILQMFSAADDPAAVGGRVEEYLRAYPPDPARGIEHDLFDEPGAYPAQSVPRRWPRRAT